MKFKGKIAVLKPEFNIAFNCETHLISTNKPWAFGQIQVEVYM